MRNPPLKNDENDRDRAKHQPGLAGQGQRSRAEDATQKRQGKPKEGHGSILLNYYNVRFVMDNVLI